MRVVLIVLLLVQYWTQFVIKSDDSATEEEQIYSNARGSRKKRFVGISANRRPRKNMEVGYSWDPKIGVFDDKEIDLKFESFFDFARKYKAARNLLKKKLTKISDDYIDAMIENEAELIQPSSPGFDNDKSETSFVLDGRESIHTPCSAAHRIYVERVELAGCQGASG